MSRQGTPLVSAIVSTYNAERFMRGKLEDLEAQSIADELEIIVIDSGSRENECAIMEEFQRRYPNIRYLRTERRETVYQAWNRGIRAARGEFVTNSNTDDRLRPDCFELLVRALREHPRCVLAYPDMRITRQENATFERHQPHGFRDWPAFDRTSLLELCCVGPFPLWRRSLHDEIGYFDERFKSAADYEFWLRAALRHDFIHVPDFLGLYWLNEETVSRKGDLPTLEYLQVQKEYRPRMASLTPPPAKLTPQEETGYAALLSLGEGSAEEALIRFVDLHPHWPRAHHDLAELYYKKGAIGYAKKHFEKAAILDPASPLYGEKLRAFLRTELYGSLQYHTAQAAEKPDDLETRLTLGMICVLLERYQAAREHYQRAAQIDPQSVLARENLAALAAISAAQSQAPASPFHPDPLQGAEEEPESGEPASAGYYSFARPEVQRLVSRKAKTVLDIGCAAGKVGAGIKKRQGATVWGIEVSAAAAAAAADILDRVIATPVEEALAQLPERQFDSIIMADVLEHLVNPEAVLLALAAKLSAAGEIVVSLPNVRHWSVLKELLEGSWEYRDAGILDRTHLRFFTRESAISMFKRAGYATASVTAVALSGESAIPDGLIDALRQGGVVSPTLETESSVYQYLFRLVPEDSLLTSIVILTFNELQCTRQCLESIERNTPQPHEVILVDNGSTDGTVAWLTEFCAGKSGYRIIENGSNLGFAAGCNIGVKAAKGGRLLLLNNDVVVTPGWLGGLLGCLELEPAAAIVGPMTNRIAGPQQVAATDYQNISELDDFARSFRTANSGRRLAADRVVGFCMLFSRRLWEEIGELDTRFGSGNYEDDDFCLRAALAGYRCAIAGDVFIHHYGSRSFVGNGIDYAAAMARNRAGFDEKWNLAGLSEEQARKVVTVNAMTRARRLAGQGHLEDAVELLLHEGIRFSPACHAPYLLLAELLVETGNYRNAIEVLCELPAGEEVKKDRLAALAQRGAGDVSTARAVTERALAIDPASAELMWLQGLLLYDQGDTAQAQELFRAAMQADPGFGPAFTEMSGVLWESGIRDQALHLSEMGFVLSPLSLNALDRFHRYATECERTPTGAASPAYPPRTGPAGNGDLPSPLQREERRIREARAIYPEHKGLAYGLIEVLIRQCRYREAMEEIERCAVAFGLDDATITAALEIRRLAGPPAPAQRGGGSVSVCMIVKDEAKQLPTALLSVKGFADEIVVVDTGSSDRSGDIARMFGARLVSFPWNGSFSDARNFSLSQAQGEWIMVLDADEALTPGDLPPLAALLKERSSPIAYSFTTRNYTHEVTRKNWTANSGEYREEERGRGWIPSDKVRLFPNDERVRFEGAVHELLELSLRRCDIPIHACDVPVHHYGKLDAAKNAEKQERYYLLGLKKMEETGGNVESLTELALQATELKRLKEAESLWQRVLESRPQSADAYFNLGYLYLTSGDFGKARAHSLTAAELAPQMKEAFFNLAKSGLLLGNLQEALSGCEKMLHGWPDYPPALSLLSVVLLLLGREDEAAALVERLRRKGYDCRDFLEEYARDLQRGEQAGLALRTVEFAERIAGKAAERQNHAC